MAHIIQQRGEITHHSLDFDYLDEPGAGFSFPCDPDGVVHRAGLLSDAAYRNYQRCQLRIENVGAPHTRSWSTQTPAILKCDCGHEVELYGFTNTCDCGCDYNSAGQTLAPRSQWGEETGESLSDILNIP